MPINIRRLPPEIKKKDGTMAKTESEKDRTLKDMSQPPSASRRPLRVDAQRNRQQLLDAAHEVLGEKGTEAPLEEIARRAGVGIGTLYRHFPTRYDLISAMYSGRMEELTSLAESLARSRPPREALFDWLRAEAQHILTYRALKIFLMSDSSGKKPAGVNWKERLFETGNTLLTRAQEAGTVRKEIDASQLLQLVHAVISADDQKGAEQMLEVVIDGLRSQRD